MAGQIADTQETTLSAQSCSHCKDTSFCQIQLEATICILLCILVLFCFLALLGIKPTAFHMLGKCSSTKLHSQLLLNKAAKQDCIDKARGDFDDHKTNERIKK
jgi:hypothetical protein